jgi:hypothetical protein
MLAFSSSLSRVLNVQSKRSGSTLLQLVVKVNVMSGFKGVRKLTPKLLKAARSRLDVSIKNNAGQTIVHTLTE